MIMQNIVRLNTIIRELETLRCIWVLGDNYNFVYNQNNNNTNDTKIQLAVLTLRTLEVLDNSTILN